MYFMLFLTTFSFRSKNTRDVSKKKMEIWKMTERIIHWVFHRNYNWMKTYYTKKNLIKEKNSKNAKNVFDSIYQSEIIFKFYTENLESPYKYTTNKKDYVSSIYNSSHFRCLRLVVCGNFFYIHTICMTHLQ